MRKGEETAYWNQLTLRNNAYYLLLCGAVMIIESLMIVIFMLSQEPGLPTLPGQYLVLYLTAVGGSLVFGVLFVLLRGKKESLRVLHMLYLVLLLLWAAYFAIYEVKEGNHAYVLAQILIFTAAGIRLPSILHCCLNAGSYLLFLLGSLGTSSDYRYLYNEWINGFIFLFLSMIIILYDNRLHYRHYMANEVVERQNRELAYQASHDSLTGLFNRRMICRCLDEQLEKSASVCCVILDMDSFKEYNDTYGHVEGDQLLTSCAKSAKIMEETARTCNGWAGRYGGEEFLLILPDIGCGAAEEAVNGLLARIREQTTPHRVTASAGGSISRKGEASNQLIRRADQALYASKEAGKDRFSWDM